MQNKPVLKQASGSGDHPLLVDLNPPQRTAVTAPGGPVLILAGAGSGKTKALTHRIAYLILEGGVLPENIFAVTFTNKAAGEMKERVARLLVNSKQKIENRNHHSPFTFDYSLHLPWLGTFHSMAAKILRSSGRAVGIEPSFTIYDDTDAKDLLKNILKDLELDPKRVHPSAVKASISGAKNELVGPTEYERYAQGYFQELVGQIYPVYEQTLRRANALDFDDLLVWLVRLFEERLDIRERYQEQFRHILVDEYQDTNKVQYYLIKLLASKFRNLCVVGDDWQAIYAFRGANYRNILDFERDWPDATVIKLEQNYRSTQTILDGAQAVIGKNIHRTDKTLWTANTVGSPITLYEASNERAEAEFLLTEIASLHRGEGRRPEDFAVLYRTNAQSRILEEMFLRYNVPYKLVGALRFYERKEVKDILAYLRLLQNPTDQVALERIINVPTRGIGQKAVGELRLQGYEALTAANPKVRSFFQMIDGLRRLSVTYHPSEIIDLVAETTGYKRFLLDGSQEGERRWENVEELKSVATGLSDLAIFLEQVALVSDVDNLDPNAGAVTLMTLHAAKGLEFPLVFMVGLEEGIFPHSRSLMEPAEMEEERRLCYVGMTRARERLYLTWARMRLLYGNMQTNLSSRFIAEIPEELVDRL